MELVNDVDYVYSSYYGNESMENLIIILAISAVILLIMIIASMKIFKKLGLPSWHAIIPILNLWDLFKAVGKKGWFILIPLYDIIVLIEVMYLLPITLGKSKIMGFLNVILPVIIMPIIAFSKNKVTVNEAVVEQVQSEVVPPVTITAPVVPEVASAITQGEIPLITPNTEQVQIVPTAPVQITPETQVVDNMVLEQVTENV